MKIITKHLLLQFVVRCVIYSVMGILVIKADPFGLGDKSDAASRDVIYRLFAPLYPTKSQDNIIVVLVNESSIQSLYDAGVIAANEWPILYQDHGYLISRIASYRPRAIYVDVFFKKERSTDGTFNSMYHRLLRASERFNVPLYFSRGYADEKLSPIQVQLSQIGELVANGWSGYVQGYPLKQDGTQTVSRVLYEDSCESSRPYSACSGLPLGEADRENYPISVLWGSKSAPPVIPRNGSECEQSQWLQIAYQIFGGLFSGFLDEEFETELIKTRCPFHKFIAINELIAIDKDEGITQVTNSQKNKLRIALKDAIVFYALDLEGVNNRISTPVHGSLPSVFFHAMALDNLIQYGPNYVRAEIEGEELVAAGIWVAIVVLISVFMYRKEREGVLNSEGDLLSDFRDSAFTVQSGGASKNQELEVIPVKEVARMRLMILGMGFMLVIAAVSTGFFIFNIEPINAVGYLVLVFIISRIIYSDTAKKVILLIKRYLGYQ